VYLLVINPVRQQSAYLRCEGFTATKGRLYTRCKVIVAFGDIPDGVKALERLKEKWYRLDVKLLEALLGTRWAVEHYAPQVTLSISNPEAVFMSLGPAEEYFDIAISMGDLAMNEDSMSLTPLFGVHGVQLERFLAGERQFATALSNVLSMISDLELEVSQNVTKAVSELHEVVERTITGTPNALELLSMFMQKYNVSGKDIVDFVANELKAEMRARQEEMRKQEALAKAMEAVTSAQPAGGGAGGT